MNMTSFIEENLSSYKISIRWLWENVSKQICQSKFYGSYQIDIIYFEEVSVWDAINGYYSNSQIRFK